LKRTSSLILLLLSFLVFSQMSLQITKSSLSPIVLTTSCPDNVTVYFLDVGQGDSILVKTPSKNILIDGGPTDAGNTILADLNTYQVSRIDLMVATHPHADHIGGLISVLQSTIPVQDIIYNGYNYTSAQTFNTWKALAITHNLTQTSRNQVYEMSPNINFTVLSPTGSLQFSDINAESIVMKLQVSNTSVLLTGDAQFDTEQSMLTSGYNLNSQVLKVGHHGSSTSTSSAFLSAVAPTYSVISAGINNQYGHPTQQTLNILSNNNIITYGTYNYGTITFSLNAPTSNPNPTPTSTGSPSPIPSPTPTATSNPTIIPTTPSTTNAPTQKPTIKPNNDPTSSPSASPTIPEFSVIATIPLLIAIFYAAVAIKNKKTNRLTSSKKSACSIFFLFALNLEGI
jgi:competence protein ComEC